MIDVQYLENGMHNQSLLFFCHFCWECSYQAKCLQKGGGGGGGGGGCQLEPPPPLISGVN